MLQKSSFDKGLSVYPYMSQLKNADTKTVEMFGFLSYLSFEPCYFAQIFYKEGESSIQNFNIERCFSTFR